MQPQEKENIIKDLLYEASARRFLQNKKGVKRNNFRILMMAAAAVALLVIAYLGFNNAGLTDSDSDALIAQVYEFPEISKSRSGEVHTIDNLLPQLNAGNYKEVLSGLEGKNLSEKDLFVKAHVYFELDNLDQASKLIEQTTWKDNYYQERIKWLQFLIAFKNGDKKNELHDIRSQLSKEFIDKADRLLKE